MLHTMLCPTCQVEIPADSTFCPKCGARIDNASVGTAPLAAVAPTATEKFRALQPAGTHQPEPEHDLWKGSFSAKSMCGTWLLAGFVTLAAIIIAVLVPNPVAWIAAAVIVPVAWLIPAIWLLMQRLGVAYTLTTQRFLHKSGVIKRTSEQILLVDVDDITYEQGILGR